MSDPTSLDALLEQIQSGTNLKLSEDLPVVTPSGPPKSAVPVDITSSGGEVTAQVALRSESTSAEPALAERNELWESNLTPRQRALPKISAQMLSGVVAIMVMIAGVGAATMLSQTSQDIRQQAFEDTTPELAGTSATLTQDDYLAQSGQTAQAESYSFGALISRQWTGMEIAFVVAAVVAIIFLLTLLIWLFSV